MQSDQIIDRAADAGRRKVTRSCTWALGCVLSSACAAPVYAQSLSTEVVYALNAGRDIHRINLATGAASLVGTVSFPQPLVSIAIGPTPETIYAVTNQNTLISFAALNPANVQSSIAVSGLQAGERIVGIDMRPSVFPALQLYAVGSTSRLYTINVGTGVATQVGTGSFTVALAGTRWGIDFNPRGNANNNLVRIVSDSGQNFRINPDTGAVSGVDTALNPGSPQVVATAYSENFPGSNSTPNPTPPPATNTTTQYGLDLLSNALVTHGGVNGVVGGGPNGGVLTTVGPLGITLSDGVDLDISNRFALPRGRLGETYSHRIFVFQGSGAYTFAITAGALPTGVSIATNGELAGVPSAQGNFSFDVTATGTGGPFARTFAVTVDLPILIFQSGFE